MKPWIIARSADMVDPAERTFVEHIDAAAPDRLTYSSLLEKADCEVLDRRAYSDARTWYRDGGADPTTESGASLGEAFEYHATIEFIRHYRAELILSRLLVDTKGAEIRLRGVGEEWAVAARSLGAAAVVERPEVAPALMAGTHAPVPIRSQRAMGRLASIRGARNARLVLVEGPNWAVPYHAALMRGTSTHLIGPGRRVLMAALRGRAHTDVAWLCDVEPASGGRLDGDMPPDSARMAVEIAFRRLRPALSAWASAGLRAVHGGAVHGGAVHGGAVHGDAVHGGAVHGGAVHGGAVHGDAVHGGAVHGGGVAVATQDVLPPSRAFLLGMKAAGGRVVTIEHGISGIYLEQVHSIADVLAAWGAQQAEYHRGAGPQGLRVAAIGNQRLEAAVADAGPGGGEHGTGGEPDWDVVFFGQPTGNLAAGDWPETHLRALRFVEEYAAAHPNRRVAVKLHPATRAYGFAIPPIRHARLVNDDSIDLIRASRVVAIVQSTTGLEAMALGRPVVQISPMVYLGHPDFLALSGATAMAGTSAQFAEELERLLCNQPDYESACALGKQFARSFVKGIDEPGGAVARLNELVRGLM
jgi:hypothetical protein